MRTLMDGLSSQKVRSLMGRSGETSWGLLGNLLGNHLLGDLSGDLSGEPLQICSQRRSWKVGWELLGMSWKFRVVQADSARFQEA